MTPKRPSLNRFLDWRKVLDALGAGGDLPPKPSMGTVFCPIGSHPGLVVMADPIDGGWWYHCSRCDFAGDAVELATRTWKIESECVAAQDMIARILGHDARHDEWTDAAVDQYIREYIIRRRAVNDLWYGWGPDRRDAYGLTLEDGLPAAYRFGLHGVTVGTESWRRGIGRFVGFARRVDVRKTVWPDVPAGAGWDPLLVVPFWNLPGRIRGFLFAGAAGMRYRRIPHGPGDVSDEARAEAGLAFYTAIQQAGPASHGAVLVSPAVEAVVRLQARHLAEHDAPLPLVASWEGADARTRIVFDHAPRPRKLVIWGPPGDPGVLHQAWSLDAEVAGRRPPAGDGFDRWLAERPPAAIVADLAQVTTSWQGAIEHDLALAMTEADGDAFLRSAHGAMLMVLGAEAGGELRARIEAALTEPERSRELTVAGKRIREDGDGWWVVRRGRPPERITDAPFRIDRVSVAADGARRYEGTIRFRGREIPFRTGAAIEKDALTWVSHFLLSSGIGVATVNPSWRRYAFMIALCLHPPDLAEVPIRVGWDGARLVFPQFTLEKGGDVGGPPPNRGDDETPCRALEPPEDPLDDDLRRIAATTPEAAIARDVVAYLAADVLCRANGLPVASLALRGRGAIRIGHVVAQACGVHMLPSVAAAVGYAAAEAARHFAGHDWPTQLPETTAGYDTPNGGRVLATLPPGCIAPATPIAALALLLRGGWHVLACDVPSLDTGIGDSPPARRVLVAYLADLARRSFPVGGRTPMDFAAADLAMWLRERGYPTRRRDDVVLTVDSADAAGDRLIALLLAIDGDIDGIFPCDSGSTRPNIDPTALAAAVASRGGPALDPDEIEARLEEAGALRGYLCDVPGWIMTENWWAAWYRARA
jgi:hypothetical protein